MIYGAFTKVFYRSPVGLQTPAKIDLFLMREKVGIESSGAPKGLTSHKKASARCPKYIAYVIVLSFVFFDGIEDI